MKRFISIIIGLSLLCNLQAQEIFRIGYCNRSLLLSQSKEAQQVEAKLKQMETLYDAEYKRMSNEYNSKIQAYMETGKTLSEPIKLARQAEITEYEERMVLYKQRYTAELSKQQSQLWASINDKITKAIEKVAQEQGVSMVLDQTTPLYISAPCIDLTPFVKKELGIE